MNKIVPRIVADEVQVQARTNRGLRVKQEYDVVSMIPNKRYFYLKLI